MPRNDEFTPDHDGDGLQREPRSRTHPYGRRRMAIVAGTAVLALAAAATPALASSSAPAQPQAHRYSGPPVVIEPVLPQPGDTAGAGGVFNVDLLAQARDAAGTRDLSAANGYKPGILPTPPPGAGHADPFAPGLVVLLSTTPAALGGPDANLAGVFQLTDVDKVAGRRTLLADWEVGKPGAFGDGVKTTLTVFVVAGQAPGTWTGSGKRISNVFRETFRIGK